MDNDAVIKVEHIGKKYKIGVRQKYLTLRDTLVNLTKLPSTIFSKNNKDTEDFWALQDVSFEVRKGEVMGIIGSNGAGKSTLLKIISRITEPTTGRITLNGRVASLLEVGTGFNSELTGRENIYLNGSILGMTTREISKKYDEIVEFSGVEKFIDTPVKHYSSGMYVRLAFSVAAHLEPDILLVDEVLAVGDAEFQKKCLGKMDEVTKNAGRTILFVSHNMDAVQSLCNRCIWLKDKHLEMVGDTNDVISSYLKASYDFKKGDAAQKQVTDKEVYFSKVIIKNDKGKEALIHYGWKDILFEFEIYSNKKRECLIALPIKDKHKNLLINMISSDYGQKFVLNKGLSKIKLVLRKNQLRKGTYFISPWVGYKLGEQPYDYVENILSIQIDTSNLGDIKTVSSYVVPTDWQFLSR